MNNKVLYFSGGHLCEAGRLLTFSAFKDGRLFEVGANLRLGAYSNKYGTFLPLPSRDADKSSFARSISSDFLVQLVAKMLSSAHQETLPCNLVP